MLGGIERSWGTPLGVDLAMWAPSIAGDERLAESSAAYSGAAASPGAALAVMRMNREIDVRGVLPSVRVPTLILHRTQERVIDVENARYMARRIPGARLVELPGVDHMHWIGDSEAIIQEVEEFLTGQRQVLDIERVLVTVLFTDMLESYQSVVPRAARAVPRVRDRHRGRRFSRLVPCRIPCATSSPARA